MKKFMFLAGAAILLVAIVLGERMFPSVGAKSAGKAVITLKDAGGVPGRPATKEEIDRSEKEPLTAAAKARARYLEGVKYFQNDDYIKAKKEWDTAAKLDPKNEDVQAGLTRLKNFLHPEKTGVRK
jgi:hypothetical protein